MSVLRPIPSIDPIRCDPSSLFAACDLGSNDLETLFCSLDTVRQECSKGSLAEVLTIPEQLLGDYSQQRSTSSLFQILQVARNIREAVDRGSRSLHTPSTTIRSRGFSICFLLQGQTPIFSIAGRFWRLIHAVLLSTQQQHRECCSLDLPNERTLNTPHWVFISYRLLITMLR